MKTIKVSEASGVVLDWLVATQADKHVSLGDIHWGNYKPSTDWSQGGPIIEREKIELRHANTGMFASYLGGPTWFGPTPLIAAMRCYVASKLGDVVQIPKELT